MDGTTTPTSIWTKQPTNVSLLPTTNLQIKSSVTTQNVIPTGSEEATGIMWAVCINIASNGFSNVLLFIYVSIYMIKTLLEFTRMHQSRFHRVLHKKQTLLQIPGFLLLLCEDLWLWYVYVDIH